MDISPQFLAQLLLNGLVIGAAYALVASGLSLIFGVMDVANFSHGELYMLGAFTAFFLTRLKWLGYWTMLPLSLLIMAAAGYVIYHALLSRSEGEESLERGLLLTIGLSMILQNGAIFLWTAQPKIVHTAYDAINLSFAGLRISLLRVFSVLVTAIALGALYILLNHTRMGKAMRGITQNREAALIVGIQPKLISSLATSIGTALAGLGGAVLAPLWTVFPVMGIPVTFKAFAIIIIGGMGSVTGSAVASILIGIIESYAGGFGSIVLRDAVAFIIMIAFLFVRPQGLLGRRIRI